VVNIETPGFHLEPQGQRDTQLHTGTLSRALGFVTQGSCCPRGMQRNVFDDICLKLVCLCSCLKRVRLCSCLNRVCLCSCLKRVFLCSCLKRHCHCSCLKRHCLCSCLKCQCSYSQLKKDLSFKQSSTSWGGYDHPAPMDREKKDWKCWRLEQAAKRANTSPSPYIRP
jgi:hypothetical protein